MKKVLLALVMVLMTACFAQAEFSLTMPMETTASGFWFPTDNTIAVGISHTVARLAYSGLPKVSLDLDGTLAKEVNEEKDNLAGIGVKINYHVQKATDTGFVFVPSIGVTALTNIKNIKDVLKDYKIAVYGTMILYKW